MKDPGTDILFPVASHLNSLNLNIEDVPLIFKKVTNKQTNNKDVPSVYAGCKHSKHFTIYLFTPTSSPELEFSCVASISLAAANKVSSLAERWLYSVSQRSKLVTEMQLSVAQHDSTWRNACGKASFKFRLAVAALRIYKTDFK